MALRNYICLSIFLLFFGACEQDNCTRFLDNSAQLKFYSSITGDDTTINNFYISKLHLDTFYFYNDKDSTAIKLPLDQTSDTCEFSFLVKNIEIVDNDTNEYDIIDTISLFYEREPQYISSGCGFRMKYKVEEISYTENNFDSIIIVEPDSLIHVDNENHFKIYF